MKGNQIVVWASVSEEGEDSELYYSVLRAGRWTTAELLATTPGNDGQLKLGLDAADGDVVITWVSDEGESQSLRASYWDGQWSEPVTVAGAQQITNVSVDAQRLDTDLNWIADGETQQVAWQHGQLGKTIVGSPTPPSVWRIAAT